MISTFNAILKIIKKFYPCIVSTFLITSEVSTQLMEIMLVSCIYVMSEFAWNFSMFSTTKNSNESRNSLAVGGRD
jgi:hypothetical protein